MKKYEQASVIRAKEAKSMWAFVVVKYLICRIFTNSDPFDLEVRGD
jgi:hypothetical protein